MAKPARNKPTNVPTLASVMEMPAPQATARSLDWPADEPTQLQIVNAGQPQRLVQHGTRGVASGSPAARLASAVYDGGRVFPVVSGGVQTGVPRVVTLGPALVQGGVTVRAPLAGPRSGPSAGCNCKQGCGEKSQRSDNETPVPFELPFPTPAGGGGVPEWAGPRTPGPADGLSFSPAQFRGSPTPGKNRGTQTPGPADGSSFAVPNPSGGTHLPSTICSYTVTPRIPADTSCSRLVATFLANVNRFYPYTWPAWIAGSARTIPRPFLSGPTCYLVRWFDEYAPSGFQQHFAVEATFASGLFEYAPDGDVFHGFVTHVLMGIYRTGEIMVDATGTMLLDPFAPRRICVGGHPPYDPGTCYYAAVEPIRITDQPEVAGSVVAHCLYGSFEVPPSLLGSLPDPGY